MAVDMPFDRERNTASCQRSGDIVENERPSVLTFGAVFDQSASYPHAATQLAHSCGE